MRKKLLMSWGVPKLNINTSISVTKFQDEVTEIINSVQLPSPRNYSDLLDTVAQEVDLCFLVDVTGSMQVCLVLKWSWIFVKETIIFNEENAGWIFFLVQ